VRILDFVDGTAEGCHLVMRRHKGITILVAEPNRIPKAQHDMVRTSATHHRLVEVIAHRVVVGEFLGIGGVAVQHVVKAHGSRSLTGGLFTGSVVGAEYCRLRSAIGLASYADL